MVSISHNVPIKVVVSFYIWGCFIICLVLLSLERLHCGWNQINMCHFIVGHCLSVWATTYLLTICNWSLVWIASILPRQARLIIDDDDIKIHYYLLPRKRGLDDRHWKWQKEFLCRVLQPLQGRHLGQITVQTKLRR